MVRFTVRSYHTMSSAVRDVANGESWFSTYTAMITGYVWQGVEWGKFGWMVGRHVGWFFVTTGLITALPLVLEVSECLTGTDHHLYV